jgi:alkaline phosphatase
MRADHSPQTLSCDRRAILRGGTLWLAAASLGPMLGDSLAHSQNEAADAPAVRIGLMTDLHHADKPPAGSRHYRETLGKLAEAGDKLRSLRPDFIVELGDIIDAADSVDTELRYLSEINRHFSEIATDRHYILGNHCVDTLTKAEFLGAIGREKSFYSFDRGGIHFVILDACFRADGQPYGRKNFQWTDANIPAEELQWLRDDLASNTLPTILFTHQRLDTDDNHGIRNAPQVREVIDASRGHVLAVLQGHSHKNDVRQIGKTFYCTLVAMIEGSGPDNNGYSLMTIRPNGDIRIDGFRNQADRHWPA